MLVRRPHIRVAALLCAAACGDGVVRPEPDVVRTVLVHRQDTGENVLLNSDGTEAGTYAPGGRILTPLGASALSRTLLFLQGDAIVLGTLDQPTLDTIVRPAPATLSLASFSGDERYVAVPSFEPTQGVIVYDRANRLADTLDFGQTPPDVAPVFSPDNRRVAWFTVTPLSLVITVRDRADPSRRTSETVGLSRFLNRPIFGWPRWVEGGIALAFVRVANDGPDTLVVGLIRPDDPDFPMDELYRAVMAPVSDNRPELGFGLSSTYALTTNAMALALGALPARNTTGRHAVYLVTPDIGRVQLVRDEPSEFLAFPLFIREQ